MWLFALIAGLHFDVVIDVGGYCPVDVVSVVKQHCELNDRLGAPNNACSVVFAGAQYAVALLARMCARFAQVVHGIGISGCVLHFAKP